MLVGQENAVGDFLVKDRVEQDVAGILGRFGLFHRGKGLLEQGPIPARPRHRNAPRRQRVAVAQQALQETIFVRDMRTGMKDNLHDGPSTPAVTN